VRLIREQNAAVLAIVEVDEEKLQSVYHRGHCDEHNKPTKRTKNRYKKILYAGPINPNFARPEKPNPIYIRLSATVQKLNFD